MTAGYRARPRPRPPAADRRVGEEGSHSRPGGTHGERPDLDDQGCQRPAHPLNVSGRSRRAASGGATPTRTRQPLAASLPAGAAGPRRRPLSCTLPLGRRRRPVGPVPPLHLRRTPAFTRPERRRRPAGASRSRSHGFEVDPRSDPGYRRRRGGGRAAAPPAGRVRAAVRTKAPVTTAPDAAPGEEAGPDTTAGAGGRWPSELCGRTVLSRFRQASIST